MPDLADDLRTYLDELARQVDAAVDVDAPPTVVRRSRRGLVAVSAVVVAAIAIGVVLALAHRSTSKSLAVDGVTTSTVPSQWQLTITPSSSLTDGESVHIHATGFGAGQMVGIVMCDARNLDPGVGEAACDLETLDQVPADQGGVLDTTYAVRRIIRVGGVYDCGEEARGCDIAVGPAIQSLPGQGVGQQITFAPGPARPLPSITLSPATDLKDGQTILVSGSNFAPNASIWVAECPPDTDCGYQAFGVLGHSDADGTFHQLLTLHRTFTVPANLPNGVTRQQLDCATGCTILAHTNQVSGQLTANIPFVISP
jgi:hypothetical protein